MKHGGEKRGGTGKSQLSTVVYSLREAQKSPRFRRRMARKPGIKLSKESALGGKSEGHSALLHGWVTGAQKTCVSSGSCSVVAEPRYSIQQMNSGISFLTCHLDLLAIPHREAEKFKRKPTSRP